MPPAVGRRRQVGNHPGVDGRPVARRCRPRHGRGPAGRIDGAVRGGRARGRRPPDGRALRVAHAGRPDARDLPRRPADATCPRRSRMPAQRWRRSIRIWPPRRRWRPMAFAGPHRPPIRRRSSRWPTHWRRAPSARRGRGRPCCRPERRRSRIQAAATTRGSSRPAGRAASARPHRALRRSGASGPFDPAARSAAVRLAGSGSAAAAGAGSVPLAEQETVRRYFARTGDGGTVERAP